LHDFGAQPWTSAPLALASHFCSLVQLKASLAQLAARQPCTSALVAAPSQTLPSAHAKPSLHGVGSQCPFVAQRAPLAQELVVQAGAHEVGVPTVQAGVGWERHTLPPVQSVSVWQTRVACICAPQPPLMSVAEQNEPFSQSLLFLQRRSGSESFFLQLASSLPPLPAAPALPLAPAAAEPPLPLLPMLPLLPPVCMPLVPLAPPAPEVAPVPPVLPPALLVAPVPAAEPP
jgi:hypothetical protein